jgi:radical SAM-linked protein
MTGAPESDQGGMIMDARNRIRLRFTKKGAARFLSHHDLMRLFERAIRRAGLPVKMSQGFNPRPKFSIAAALGVGVAAENEILDVELDEPVDPAVVRKRLAQVAIPGMEIIDASRAKRKSARVVAGLYEVQLPPDAELPEGAVDALLAQDEVIVERTTKKKSKRIDIRPCILDIRRSGPMVRMRLQITDTGAPRPEEVIGALAGEPGFERNRLQIVRTDLELAPDEQA